MMVSEAVKARMTYSMVAAEAEKPYAERQEVTTARGNRKKPRRYHLALTVVQKLRDAKVTLGQGFMNPFNRQGGIYYACVQALGQLGPDEWHKIGDVKRTIAEIMESIKKPSGKSAWEEFKTKQRRGKNQKDGQTPADVQSDDLARINQNFHVLQRLGGAHPYGAKLAQLGQCIDIQWDSEAAELKDKGLMKELRLRTTYNYPTDWPLNACKKKTNVKPMEKDTDLLKICRDSIKIVKDTSPVKVVDVKIDTPASGTVPAAQKDEKKSVPVKKVSAGKGKDTKKK